MSTGPVYPVPEAELQVEQLRGVLPHQFFAPLQLLNSLLLGARREARPGCDIERSSLAFGRQQDLRNGYLWA
jgi:hypothetical protein